MPVRRYPDWESFEIAPAARRPPGRVLRGPEPGERTGRVPARDLPASRGRRVLPHVNEVRYEEQVADGTIGLVGRARGPVLGGVVVARSPAGDRRGGVHLGRNTRKQLRRDEVWTTANARFAQVAEECRAGREPRWLTDACSDPGRAARRGLGAQHRGVAGRRPGRRRDGHRHRPRDQRRFVVRRYPARRGSRSRTWPRDSAGRRPAHRRAVGQPVPAVARRRAGAARALPAPAGPLGGADLASR